MSIVQIPSTFTGLPSPQQPTNQQLLQQLLPTVLPGTNPSPPPIPIPQGQINFLSNLLGDQATSGFTQLSAAPAVGQSQIDAALALVQQAIAPQLELLSGQQAQIPGQIAEVQELADLQAGQLEQGLQLDLDTLANSLGGIQFQQSQLPELYAILDQRGQLLETSFKQGADYINQLKDFVNQALSLELRRAAVRESATRRQLAREQEITTSETVARGAITSPGYKNDLTFIEGVLEDELALLGLDRESAHLTAKSQIATYDKQMDDLVTDRTAQQLSLQEQRLTLDQRKDALSRAAEQIHIDEQRAALALQQALTQANIAEANSVAALLAQQNQLALQQALLVAQQLPTAIGIAPSLPQIPSTYTGLPSPNPNPGVRPTTGRF